MKKAEEYDYEGEMAKTTLRKLIVFSNELLPMIEDDKQLPAWLQDKFSKLDYYISAVYSYMKFSENGPDSETESEDDQSEDMSEMPESEPSESESPEMELEINIDGIVKK
jgi:predicted S18 family serine protease